MRKHFFRNTGKGFESELKRIAEIYETKKLLALEKVDPPVKVLGSGEFRKVIFLPNPFLDYVGTWTERGGRAVFLEAKSYETQRLPIGDGGLTQKQGNKLKRWHSAGAAVGMLWECKGMVVFFSMQQIDDAFYYGRKSLQFEHGEPVQQGQGFILYDYIENLRRAYPVPACPNSPGGKKVQRKNRKASNALGVPLRDGAQAPSSADGQLEQGGSLGGCENL